MRRILTYRLFEDRRQMELPFGKTPYKKRQKAREPSLSDKPIHVHVLDALQDMSVMPVEKYFSRKEFRAEWDKAYPKAVERFKDSDLGKPEYMEFVGRNRPWDDDEDDPIWKEKYLKDNEWDFVHKPAERNVYSMIEDVAEDLEQSGITVALTQKGAKTFDDFLGEFFGEQVEDNGVFYTVKDSYDKNGLISVWREVDYAVEDEDKKAFKDIYLQILHKYKGVGAFWSWDEDKAEAYWGSSASGKVSLVLYGRVAVEDVDWGETIFKNGSSLREEKEITIKGNVLIHSIKDVETDKTIELEERVVVPAGNEKVDVS